MDEIKKDLAPYRGCFIFFGVCLVLAIGGGIGALTQPLIGDYSMLAALGGIVIAVLIWIGLAKGARWAKMIAGILLIIIGLGISLLILFDFGAFLFTGTKVITHSVGGSYGQSVFLFLMIGLGILGGGLVLVGLIKIN
jgi:hypothetical protein